MLKKRLIGVITVRNGWAVQSFSYGRYLPLGKPEVLAQNLDRWGVDEILLQSIDRSAKGLGPDYSVLQKVSGMGLGTPLIYSGGISRAEHGVDAVKMGADRICIDAVLHDRPEVAHELSDRLGAQAIIASMPLSASDNGLSWLDHRSGENKPVSGAVLQMLEDKIIAEAMLIDWQNEGCKNSFDFRLLEKFSHHDKNLIVFGGLSEVEQLQKAFAHPEVAAVAVGNFLNYREHAVAHYKSSLSNLPIRPSL